MTDTPPDGTPPADPTDTPDRRREMFLALVLAQDAGMSVAASRVAVATRFGVSEDLVREVEREGLANQWPPL